MFLFVCFYYPSFTCEYEYVCVRLVAGVLVVVGCPRELIGSSLEDKGLKAGSSKFLWALLCCPRLPAIIDCEKCVCFE